MRLAFAPHHDLRSKLIADISKRVIDVAAARVHLGRDLVLDERLVQLARRFQTARARQMILARTEFRPLQRQLRGPVVGVFLEREGVFGDSPVVILGQLGAFAGAVGASSGTPLNGD